MSVRHKFHKFLLLELNEGMRTTINKYVKRLRIGAYWRFWRWGPDAPKALSDIFESLAGAVLIDGGWSAFKGTFGKILLPFIVFCCKFYDIIEINRYEFLQNECLVQHLKIEGGEDEWEKRDWKVPYLFLAWSNLGRKETCIGLG
jgi:hypothetical protein